jgi:asparagine synthase (glutamine-hydrolysing)
MPGICGIAGDGPGKTDVLSRMLAALRRHDWYREHAHRDADGRAALGRVSLGDGADAPDVARSPDGSSACVIDGEIYGLPDGAAAQALLDRCQAGSLLEWLRAQHGLFAAAAWDGRTSRLWLVTDRFGMKPLYYATSGGRLSFASTLLALAADAVVKTAPDPRGLVDFFAYGQLLGNRTLCRDVSVVPPGTVLAFDARTGALTSSRYWQLASRDVDGGPAAQRRVVEAFKAAVDRRLTPGLPTAVSLSGGLDARTILAVIDERVHTLSTVTVGTPGSIDQKAAARMAELTGSRHCQITLDTAFLDRFEEHFRHEVSLTDGQHLTQAITLPALPRYRELGVRVLLRGHAGELLHMSKAYNFSMDDGAFAISSGEALRAWLQKQLCAWMLAGVDGPVLRSCSRADFDGLASQSLDEALREVEPVQPLLHKIWALFIGERLRRETALSMLEYGSLMRVRLPYLDNDLIDALFAVPPEQKRAEELQQAILRAHRPQFLDIVNANTGTRIGAPEVVRRLSTFKLRVLSKLGVPGYQPYERLGLWLRRELRPFAERTLLGPRCLDRGILEPDTVKRVLSAHFEERANHTYAILAMLTLEVGQQLLSGEVAGQA